MSLAPQFASRLNSFAARPELFWDNPPAPPSTLDLLERAAHVPGLTMIDLNYPDHLEGISIPDLQAALARHHLMLNGFAMRYYTDPAFELGAFTNPDPAVREKAIDLTCQGIDTLVAAGGHLMTIWLGQDGYDYAFQADYEWLWEKEVEGIRRVAAHNPDVMISIEYKPAEPRAFSVTPDIGTTLLAIQSAGMPNLGVTLDFCHVLMAGEQPAASAALVNTYSRLLGLHLNDGYAALDDGLMAGSVHPLQTLELLYYFSRARYSGAIYFDTFPVNEDPVAECATNIHTVNSMIAALESIDPNEMQAIMQRQDAIAATRLVQGMLFSPTKTPADNNK